MNTYIVLAFIVAAIALLLEWLLFARLREIAANTRETRNACETIKTRFYALRICTRKSTVLKMTTKINGGKL